MKMSLFLKICGNVAKRFELRGDFVFNFYADIVVLTYFFEKIEKTQKKG